MQDDHKRAIEQSMIKDDASFMVGLLFATSLLPGKSNIPYLFSSIDFNSLIMHEAYTYYVKHDTAMATRLQNSYAKEIKQSRQRVKLYDDKKLGIEGIGKTLIETITEAHQNELTKNHRIKLPRWAWKDIGLYFAEGNPAAVGSTHLGSFNMGIDTVRMFDGNTAKEFGEVSGRFFVTIAKNSIMLVRLPQLNITAYDTQSEEIYTQQKYGSSLETINAGLSIIDMNSNFTALCLPPSTQHPPIFKWKFLTTYHAVSSLKKLRNSAYAETINSVTLNKIDHVVNTQFAQFLESEGATVLRNTLTHYGIDSRIDIAKLSLEPRQYYGLIEAAIPNTTYKELAKQLDTFIQDEMLNMFKAW